MQRRTLLGPATSAGIVGVLGATVGVADQPSAPPATYSEEPVPPAVEWNGPVGATDTTTAGSETYGTVRQYASVLNLNRLIGTPSSPRIDSFWGRTTTQRADGKRAR